MKHIATAPPTCPSRRRGGRRFAMDYKRGDTPVAQRTYAYDQLGRPTARTSTRQGTTRNDAFTYNDRSELIGDVVDGTGLNGWDYDNIGNRRMEHRSDGYEIYTANQLNQYTAIEEAEGTFTPTYDADGNQTRVKTSTGIWNVTYNAKNRPILFTKDDNSVSVECTYDYMGRRATKKVTENGTVTLHQRYLYRGYLQIACCDLLRPAHPCIWLITWDPTQPIATRPLAIQKDSTWYTYGWDLTKNIWEAYTTTGYIGTAYTYSAYGQVTASGSITQPIQWSSEYNDTELGLVYYNYRYYDATAGKWHNRDAWPIIRGASEYDFIKNQPISSSDDLGLIQDRILALYNEMSSSLKRCTNKSISSFKEFITSYDEKARVRHHLKVQKSLGEIKLKFIEFKAKAYLKGSSDGCCLDITFGGSLDAKASGAGFVTLTGGVSLGVNGTYKYCWPTSERDWTGSIHGTGQIGVRIGADILVSAAYLEAGIFVGYKYDFASSQDDFTLGIYGRVVVESFWSDIEYKISYDGSDFELS